VACCTGAVVRAQQPGELGGVGKLVPLRRPLSTQHRDESRSCLTGTQEWPSARRSRRPCPGRRSPPTTAAPRVRGPRPRCGRDPSARSAVLGRCPGVQPGFADSAGASPIRAANHSHPRGQHQRHATEHVPQARTAMAHDQRLTVTDLGRPQPAPILRQDRPRSVTHTVEYRTVPTPCRRTGLDSTSWIRAPRETVIYSRPQARTRPTR
jgi:hypothetical protein